MSDVAESIMDQEDEVLSNGWVVVRHKTSGKFWGILYTAGYAKHYGWCEKLDPYLIHEYKRVRLPEQAPHRTKGDLQELVNNGVVVNVELTVA